MIKTDMKVSVSWPLWIDRWTATSEANSINNGRENVNVFKIFVAVGATPLEEYYGFPFPRG